MGKYTIMRPVFPALYTICTASGGRRRGDLPGGPGETAPQRKKAFAEKPRRPENRPDGATGDLLGYVKLLADFFDFQILVEGDDGGIKIQADAVGFLVGLHLEELLQTGVNQARRRQDPWRGEDWTEVCMRRRDAAGGRKRGRQKEDTS